MITHLKVLSPISSYYFWHFNQASFKKHNSGCGFGCRFGSCQAKEMIFYEKLVSGQHIFSTVTHVIQSVMPCVENFQGAVMMIWSLLTLGWSYKHKIIESVLYSLFLNNKVLAYFLITTELISYCSKIFCHI